MQDLLAELAPFRDVALSYLAQAPEEANAIFLRRALFGASLPMTKSELRARIVQADHDDFVSGDLVLVNGWLLSRTSLRMSALAVLSGKGASV